MTENQFKTAVADKTGLTKVQVSELFTVVGDVVARETKKGEPVPLPGLGRVRLVKRAARMGRNPQTGEAIKIRASKKLRFTVAKPLRERVGSK